MSVHGGKLAAKALKQAGVECIFTLSGGHVMAIYDGCIDEGIKVVDVRHEQAAVHAADAWSRLNPGKVGCAVLTAGPGVTDGVTGVANAWRANSPILVIGGQGPLNNHRRGSLQEMDHVAVMKPITKWADTCYATERIPEYIEMGIRQAVSGNPGPAFLEIPMDILGAEVELDQIRFPTIRTVPPLVLPAQPDIDEALDILAGAQRPVMMVGTSVKWSNAASAVQNFIERVHIPTFVNGMGRGAVKPGTPELLNRVRKDAIKQCDVFVCAGVLLDFRLAYGNTIPADAKIIQVEIENELIGTNRSADAAVVGNIAASFDALTASIDTGSAKLDYSAWCETLIAKEAQMEAAFAAELNSDEVPIDPLRLCREIRDFVADKDVILIGDGGDIVAQASKVLPVPEENCWMDPGPLGTLGVGMPFALAAQLAKPDKRVLIIYGDGAFGLNGFEYDTAVRFGLPIVGIVGVDGAWGQMVRPQAQFYGKDRIIATKLNYTRYDKIVEAMGGHGEYCERPEEIGPALARAFAAGKPALVNVVMRQDVETGMKGSTYT